MILIWVYISWLENLWKTEKDGSFRPAGKSRRWSLHPLANAERRTRATTRTSLLPKTTVLTLVDLTSPALEPGSLRVLRRRCRQSQIPAAKIRQWNLARPFALNSLSTSLHLSADHASVMSSVWLETSNDLWSSNKALGSELPLPSQRQFPEASAATCKSKSFRVMWPFSLQDSNVPFSGSLKKIN